MSTDMGLVAELLDDLDFESALPCEVWSRNGQKCTAVADWAVLSTCVNTHTRTKFACDPHCQALLAATDAVCSFCTPWSPIIILNARRIRS